MGSTTQIYSYTFQQHLQNVRIIELKGISLDHVKYMNQPTVNTIREALQVS